jgi:hypothetical protein
MTSSAEEDKRPEVPAPPNLVPDQLNSTDQDVWTRDDGEYEERTYRYGKSIVTRRNLANPPETNKEENRIRPQEEFPGVGNLLPLNGKFDPVVKYPALNKEEIGEITRRCDNLLENRRGGKKFLIYSTERGTIAVAQINKTPEARKATPLLEFRRQRNGELQEIFGPGRKSSVATSEWTPDNKIEEISNGNTNLNRINRKESNTNEANTTENKEKGDSDRVFWPLAASNVRPNEEDTRILENRELISEPEEQGNLNKIDKYTSTSAPRTNLDKSKNAPQRAQ